MNALETSWRQALSGEFEKPYWKKLQGFLEEEYADKTVFPSANAIYRAFTLTPLPKVRVVILGQDPYHGQGQAHGLAFSVLPGVAIPPSLKNIFKELHNDLGCKQAQHGFLEHWAIQGVLLLNTVLTVRQAEAFSHKAKGWEQFTDAAIDAINKHCEPVVFILWGKGAQQKASRVNANKHLVITAPHPSPLSAYRGFFGSKPFSKANAFLTAQNRGAIDWCLAAHQ